MRERACTCLAFLTYRMSLLQTHKAMSSAAAKAMKGVLTYEEFLTIFESHNRAYLDDVGLQQNDKQIPRSYS